MSEVINLKKGGIWVGTPLGGIQFGSPSETIKDTLHFEGGVPEYFVLGDELFSAEQGVSLADIEFPVFYHLFGHRRALKLIARPEVADVVQRAIHESLIGPKEKDVDLATDFPVGSRTPDLQREWEYFRRGPYPGGMLTIGHGLEVIPIEKECAHLGNGVILHEEEQDFHLEWKGKTREKISKKIPLPKEEDFLPKRSTIFHPPDFGITVLGRSNGFDPDPNETTTGFILWLGGRGIMVDPPVSSTAILKNYEIDRQFVRAVLLTHCHSDHDAGLLRHALTGPVVTLYTTPNIYASYRRKWSTLSGIPEQEFDRLFDFRPVRIGVSTPIENAEFIFRYTLHSIPTIAFEAHFGGLSCNYSSDTLNEPEAVEAMYQDGGIEKERREELLNFDWEHDLIIHEAGIPPLHTPVAVLERLPQEIRNRVCVVHATPSKHAKNPRLQIARIGREETMRYDTQRSKEDAMRRKLSLLSQTKLFESLPIRRILELMDITNEEIYGSGEYLVRDGDRPDKIYVISAGRAAIKKDSKELKVYGVGDYIGETGVFLDKTRNADVIAKTDLHVLAIDGERCYELCKGTQIPLHVKRHDKVREWDAWSLFEESPLLSGMTVTQKTEIESYLKPCNWSAGRQVHRIDQTMQRLVLVISGVISARNGSNEEFGRGTIVGSASDLVENKRYKFSAVVREDAQVLCLGKSDLKKFLNNNPGMWVRLQPWRVQEHRERANDMMDKFLEEYS